MNDDAPRSPFPRPPPLDGGSGAGRGRTVRGAAEGCGALPDYTVIRGPEGGLVMVRGRAGGGGSAFNLGEMTVTRCTVRTETGFVGHAYIAGRDEQRADWLRWGMR